MGIKINPVFKIIILSAIFLNIYADDILTDYRKNGINNLEHSLDLALTNKSYWLEYLKGKDTTFGYLEKYLNVLTCNIETSKLKLYSKENDKFNLKTQSDVYTGKNGAGKKKEGDLKTPVGVYDLVEKKGKRLDPFYGPYAFVTSYPNIYDKYLGKTGHGIWIHGVPKKESRDDFTKGCIALGNDNLCSLEKTISYDETLLLINRKFKKECKSKDKLASILSNLYRWRYAWLYNKADIYLSFYSKDFKRFDGKNYKQFSEFKRRIFKKKEKKTIIFSNISVVPYPDENNVYKISFDEYYKSKSFEFDGHKALMVRYANNKIKIFTER
jgi:murein L,D-transpeptidase YafK